MLSRLNNKSKRCILFLSILIIEFIICRYILFDLHGMKDIPFMLFDIAVFTLILAVYNDYTCTTFSLAFGYILWFVCGYLFQSEGIDAHGGVESDMWFIWMMGFLVTALICFAIDLFRKKRKISK